MPFSFNNYPVLQHLVPGGAFIISLVVGMFALAQGREMRKYSTPHLSTPSTKENKRSLEDIMDEIKTKYPPQSDYEMKQV